MNHRSGELAFRFVNMTLGSHTIGWVFTFLLCFTLFNGTWGVCRDVPDIDFAEPVEPTKENFFVQGTTLQFKCKKGYDPVPDAKNVLTCLGRTWTPHKTFCTPVLCAAPELPANGEYHPQKDEYTYLDSVTFSCQKPLEVVGNPSISCTGTGEWSSNSPTCKVVNCLNPHVPNGIKISGTSGPYTLNSIVRFTCRIGTHVLHGSDTIKCNQNSQWEPAPPRCLGVCRDVPDIDFAEPVEPTKENFFVQGTTLQFGCKKGYDPVPDAKNVLTCLGRTWTPHKTFCTPISCGKPGSISNGYIQTGTFLFGSSVTYACNLGYAIIGDRYRRCQADGNWSLPIPECEAVLCAAPELPANGEYHPQKDEYTYLDSVTFSCQKPLEVAGNPSISCTGTGEWSSNSPTCKAVNCPNPDVTNSRRLSGFTGPYTLNSVISFACDKGFILRGSGSISCNIDSQWVPAIPQCERESTAKPVLCAAPELPANGEYHPQKDEYTYLDSVTFSCQKPLEVAGNPSISCTGTGEWSSNSPTCKAVNCANPDVTNSRRLSGFIGPYTLNSAISFECDKCCVINGSSSISCNIDSQWVPAIPQCETVICAAPESPADGEYFPKKDKYTYLDSVKFLCRKPLQVVGNASISCTATGKWSSDSPTCKEILCGDPGTIQNGQISSSTPDFKVGSKATYTCNEGFAFPLTSKMNYRICQENGAWSDLTLVCTAICKENPHVPPFALLKETSTIYYNGTVVRFECKPGFTSNGKEKTITCRDHSWSDPEEFCTRISCGDPGKIKNGHVSASDYLFGSRVKYTCEEGYVMNTTQNFTECQADGTWSTAIGCKDTSKSEGIGIWTIVGILSVIVAAAALSGACYCLCNLSKKRKTGEYNGDVDKPEL
ncbi:C4b-binding protein alpha chain-like [Aquarana catesbeiana]|uniref:C4b-binding protein alpha chain-like n=1 Tax=Aquarana catesbeiana TaxID=8400 RepID=UPI003CC94B34